MIIKKPPAGANQKEAVRLTSQAYNTTKTRLMAALLYADFLAQQRKAALPHLSQLTLLGKQS